MQNCRVCKIELNSENAYVNRVKKRFQTACKTCGYKIACDWREKNHTKERERCKKYYNTNKEKILIQLETGRLRRKYGLTREQIEIMKEIQGGKCKICKVNEPSNIDHCHKTNVIRGLLCNFCNTGLGMFKDNTNILFEAINYLKNSKQVLCVKGG